MRRQLKLLSNPLKLKISPNKFWILLPNGRLQTSKRKKKFKKTNRMITQTRLLPEQNRSPVPAGSVYSAHLSLWWFPSDAATAEVPGSWGG